jgi:hypothetical protein
MYEFNMETYEFKHDIPCVTNANTWEVPLYQSLQGIRTEVPQLPIKLTIRRQGHGQEDQVECSNMVLWLLDDDLEV